ncbi:hypothetical protein BCV72DRAFT_200175, partial [Rhizopus microsporus var. microsporus]
DDVIGFQDFHSIEMLLLEVYKAFMNTNITKIHFDHHKGIFDILSMLKNVADQFRYGNIR